MIRLLPKRGALVLPVTAQEWRDVLATRLLVEDALHPVGDHLRARPGGRPGAGRAAGRPARGRRRSATCPATSPPTAPSTPPSSPPTNNMILIRLYASLRDRQLRMGAANLLAADGQRRRGPDAANTVADHEAIAAAIGAADLELAEQLTREHLAHADRALRGAGA